MIERVHKDGPHMGFAGVLAISLALTPAMAQNPTGAQATDTEGPTFEVASVKLVPPTARGPNRTGGSPERLRYAHAYMLQLLAEAFQMQADQLVAPKWVAESPDRFEIIAKHPPKSAPDEIRAMMRNLLKERFHLAYHLDQKEFDIYELVVAKGGPKLQPAEIPGELPNPPGGPARKPTGKDGYPILPPGWPIGIGAAANGSIYVPLQRPGFFRSIDPSAPPIGVGLGLIRFSCRMVTIPQLLGVLQSLAGIPHAVDHTGLGGTYDVKLAFSLGASEPGREMGDASDPAPDLFHATEKQLGLKFRKTRATLPVVVIDHIARTPTEN